MLCYISLSQGLFLNSTGNMVNNLYGSCGSRNIRQITHREAIFTGECDWQLWSRYNIGVYGRKTVFSAPFCEYSSNLKTVSQKKFGLGPKKYIGTFHLVHTQFDMLSGPTHPLFACNMQWKFIEGLTPPTPPRCVCTKWKAPYQREFGDPHPLYKGQTTAIF